ncbi:uncharacterized protein LOC112692120 isoform X2 [Sipha flava]|nr:uncharacterized protein LOC112692120 isoform X2 [Sipha flava]
MKNALLESQKNKINKVSFWTHSLFPFDSKHNLLNSNNNSQDFPYQHQFDGKHSKLCNEPKQIECSEKSSLTINDLISHSEMNGNIDQCSKNVVVDLGEKCVDDNNKKLDILDVVTNKRKPIKEQLDFEFKKPYNPFHGINYGSTNSNISKVQPNSTNKENNLIENQEKVESLKSPVKTIQDNLNDNKQLHLMYSMKSAKQSDSINLNSDKIIMFDDILLQLESTSNEENKTSGLYWNNCNVPVSENSGNYSFCGSDLSELFGNVYDFSQFAEMKLNFMNSLDSDSNTPNDTDFQKLKNNITQKSIDVMFHNHENESFKKINNENCMSMNTSTANESNDLIQSTKLNFESTESFMFNFN